MIYNLDNPYDVPKFFAHVKKVAEGRKVVELTCKNPKRSMAQNNYLHLLLSWFGLRFGYTMDEVKQLIFKRTCNPDLFRKEIVDRWTGEVCRTWKSTADLTTAEMTVAIERFRNWSASEAHFPLPSAADKGFLLEIQAEVQRNAEYAYQISDER